MECREVRDKLVEFMDNEVSEEVRKAIQTHLDNCADCFKVLKSFQTAMDLCRHWRAVEPSENWETELRRKLTQAHRRVEIELEILRSAVIGLSRRVQKLEESQVILPPTLEGEIMTVNELARYLRLSTDQIYQVIDQIPKFQIGYEYRFVRATIDQWIRTLEREPYLQNYPLEGWSET